MLLRRIAGGRRTIAVTLSAALASLVLFLAPPVNADDAFDRALAEIDEALETNPHNVPPESLRSCRAMRKTALLLRDMGKHTRAFRRLKSCRRLLGLEGYGSGWLPDPELRGVG